MSDSRSEGPTRREAATARRREQILEAALARFVENGYHQTGVRDIAERAGVSVGNVYNHFPSKHHILVEVAELERIEFDRFRRLLAPSDPPASETLHRFVSEYVTFLATPENLILAIELTSEAIRQPDIGELFVANREGLAASLTSVLERGVETGELRADLDASGTARLILELVEGAAYRSLLGDNPVQRIIDDVSGFVSAALRKG